MRGRATDVPGVSRACQRRRGARDRRLTQAARSNRALVCAGKHWGLVLPVRGLANPPAWPMPVGAGPAPRRNNLRRQGARKGKAADQFRGLVVQASGRIVSWSTGLPPIVPPCSGIVGITVSCQRIRARTNNQKMTVAAHPVMIAANTPNRLHRFHRLQSVFGGPYSSGGSRHRKPLRLMETIPPSTRRSPTLGLAWLLGKKGSGRAVCASVSQNRLWVERSPCGGCIMTQA